MRNFIKISLLVFLLNIAAKANASNKVLNPIVGTEVSSNSNDTSTNIKSNIIIFKIISNPIPSSNTNQSGSLKKAGKVARTSYSHTSIETLLNKNKGI